MAVGICETITPEVFIIRKINLQPMDESLLGIERL
jgi:hypothetical protein